MSADTSRFQVNGIDQYILDDLHHMTEEVLEELVKKWKTMYHFNSKFAQERFQQFKQILQEFYDDILDSEETKKLAMVEEVETKLKESRNLQKELRVKIHHNFDQTEPLSVIINAVEDSMKEFKELRARRVAALETLKAKETELCELLTKTPLAIFDEVPSESQLLDLEHHILELQQEKVERMDIFIKTKNKIVDMMTALEIEPQLSFEREVFTESENTFKLSANNMEKLEALEASLSKQVDEARSRIHFLQSKLENIWNRINEDRSYKSEFCNSHRGIGKSTLKAIQDELVRCEKIKLANIKPMIESARKDIVDLWDKLVFAEEQRKDFHPFYSDLFSEEVLELHEIEINKLTSLYEESRKIIELADKREGLWQRMLHFDEVALDKNRLFNNRGGQLLKEEKERKMLENNLPKIDTQLRLELMKYLEKHGSPFLWYGEDLLVKITSSWEERLARKQSRVLTKMNDQNTGMLPSGKYHQGIAAKRRMPTTPLAVRPPKNLKKTPSQQILRSRANTPATTDLSNASVASYSQFQEQIQSIEFKTPKSTAATPRSIRKPYNKENSSPLRAHSSPTSTPGRTPKRGLLYLPKTPSKFVTPSPRKLFK